MNIQDVINDFEGVEPVTIFMWAYEYYYGTRNGVESAVKDFELYCANKKLHFVYVEHFLRNYEKWMAEMKNRLEA